MSKAILSVEDLRLDIPLGSNTLNAIRGVDFSLREGETLGIVGESGSGKSLTVLSVLGLHPAGSKRTAKSMQLEGIDLLNASDRELSRSVRGTRAGMIFQEPMTSLNPVMPIGRQMTEALLVHKKASSKEARERAIQLLERVGIAGAASRMQQFPHQFSGGQRQRIMIAMALTSRPKLIIADEPTTALDVTVQAEILDLLKELQDEMGMAMILVSHNLSVMARTADRIAVMYAGRIAETGPAQSIFTEPHHPYTRGLLGALPEHARKGQKLQAIAGIVPSLIGDIQGCAFAPRCVQAMPECQQLPPRRVVGTAQVSECWLADRTEVKTDKIMLSEPQRIDITADNINLLTVRDVRRKFSVKRGLFGGSQWLEAVRGVDLDVRQGEFFALVGESGCGKSTLAQILLNLDKPNVGKVTLNGRDLSETTPYERARLVQPIFQDPQASLNPHRTVHEIVRRPLDVHHIGQPAERDAKVHNLLATVGLSERVYNVRPAALSGGQRQRVAIARALVLEPPLLLCDEPTSALDVSIQAQILNLLSDLQRKHGLTVFLITHDLSVVKHMADRMAVMYLGQVVETGRVDDILAHPVHPYTQALLRSAFPDLNCDDDTIGKLLPGFPNPMDIPAGCSFNPRCPKAIASCRETVPELRSWRGGQVRCDLAENISPIRISA